MFIFYDTATGQVEFTVSGDSYLPSFLEEGKSVIEADLPPDAELGGWRVIDGVPVQVDLTFIKNRHLTTVRTIISDVRSQFVTVLPGQEMIYLNKEKEAAEYVAATDPDINDFPMIQSEVGVTAPTAYQVAQVWLYMGAQWRAVAASLERIRMVATNSINSATTETEVLEAVTDMQTALAALGA